MSTSNGVHHSPDDRMDVLEAAIVEETHARQHDSEMLATSIEGLRAQHERHARHVDGALMTLTDEVNKMSSDVRAGFASLQGADSAQRTQLDSVSEIVVSHESRI